ncbi:O-methylsterigmatocystin oxidoreductase [Leucoagaricus sp. SymC.cos]|nr:O-methylsterigmatocystin oxidoreductase [Leucoagaricus sp. SymC.cos]
MEEGCILETYELSIRERARKLVQKQVKEGTALPCMATKLIANLPEEDSPDRAEEELMARRACAVAFVGGADTSVSGVQTFFMAMCLYPEVQKKAHAELDKVLCGRLPEFNDRDSLPYINAMVKESFRWQQVAPLGMASPS